ncbi:protein of unknown function [Taphrina deformans PYCC 5710]|uniref:Uncharacterized protein n=1 Tax=Taphrina deformans (strain PYCC 5710 / ATCC 11124 / CBS 356.35 / IMI 108563 / JCM 9778 / NBRC 8474) TaxID=1097556 RepID=R4XF71_TAPDE|nr:protein of unknown function [Taphrina deformans PYCC 5710]|eukprot:CCG84426.1 protein of unknown function [Taphrina deformans PYCC 5710]
MTIDDSSNSDSSPTAASMIGRAKEPKKRQKKPYTHSAYVCDKCRKSHRKCTHSREDKAKVSSTSPRGESCPARNTVKEVAKTSSRRSSITQGLSNEVSQVPITFFIDNINNIFGFSIESKEQTAFWRRVVPQLSHSYPLLRDGISGLCYLFDACPRPNNLTPSDVLRLISNTLSGLQDQLRRFETLHSADKTVSLILTAFLAAVTFFGLGSIEVLRSHIKGLHAILTSSWPDLTATSSPARQILLASRPRLLVSEQTPISLKHVYLFEPLFGCMTPSELQAPEIFYGSLMHLMVLTNKAVIAREAVLERKRTAGQAGETGSVDQSSSTSSFAELSEYRIEQYVRHDQFREGNLRQPRELFVAIKDVFEYATLTYLKRSVGIPQHSQLTNLRADSAMLKNYMAAVWHVDPAVVLKWPELVLKDIENSIAELARAVSMNNSAETIVKPNYQMKTGGLRPWSNLDAFLSLPLQEVP